MFIFSLGEVNPKSARVSEIKHTELNQNKNNNYNELQDDSHI